MSQEGYLERSIEVQQRHFQIRIILMDNGCFISITEGSGHRIGSLNVSLHGSAGVNTAKVIPTKHDSLFLNMVSERVAAMINGICITSLYTRNALELDTMKKIMGTTDLISDGHGLA